MNHRWWRVPFPWPTLRGLILANALVLSVSAGIGWSRAAAVDARVHMARVRSHPGEAFWDEARVIFKANARLTAFLVLGACTFGVLTVVLLAWNGYLLGFGVAALHRAAPGDLLYFMAYGPLEFAGFTLAAAASIDLALRVLRTLVEREPLALRAAATAFMAAMVLVAVAAGVESFIKVHLLITP